MRFGEGNFDSTQRFHKTKKQVYTKKGGGGPPGGGRFFAKKMRGYGKRRIQEDSFGNFSEST